MQNSFVDIYGTKTEVYSRRIQSANTINSQKYSTIAASAENVVLHISFV